MSLHTLLQKIGHFFEGLFQSAEKAFNSLSPEVQAALKEGTGIVAFINQNIANTPDGIKQLILEAFPAITEDDLKNILAKVASELNLGLDATSTDLNGFIDAVQNYLKSKTGSGWAVASDTISKIIAVFRAPAGTKATVLMQLVATVYHLFFYKPKP